MRNRTFSLPALLRSVLFKGERVSKRNWRTGADTGGDTGGKTGGAGPGSRVGGTSRGQGGGTVPHLQQNHHVHHHHGSAPPCPHWRPRMQIWRSDVAHTDQEVVIMVMEDMGVVVEVMDTVDGPSYGEGALRSASSPPWIFRCSAGPDLASEVASGRSNFECATERITNGARYIVQILQWQSLRNKYYAKFRFAVYYDIIPRINKNKSRNISLISASM